MYDSSSHLICWAVCFTSFFDCKVLYYFIFTHSFFIERERRNKITICENTQQQLFSPDKPVGELLHKSIDLIPVSKHAAWPAKKQQQKKKQAVRKR